MDDMTSAEAPASANEDLRPAAPLPAGDYAIVEIMGHRTLIGRTTEVARFGSNMLAIEPLFGGKLLPEVLLSGTAIFQFTPCSAAVAQARQPTRLWQLPSSVVAAMPAAALPAPDADQDLGGDGEPLFPQSLDDGQ
jgi:hypothetical protein